MNILIFSLTGKDIESQYVHKIYPCQMNNQLSTVVYMYIICINNVCRQLSTYTMFFMHVQLIFYIHNEQLYNNKMYPFKT